MYSIWEKPYYIFIIMYAVASRPPLQKWMCISRKHFVLYVNFESKIDSISFKKSFTMHINSPEYRIILHMFSNFLTMFFLSTAAFKFRHRKKNLYLLHLECVFLLYIHTTSNICFLAGF